MVQLTQGDSSRTVKTGSGAIHFHEAGPPTGTR